MKTHTQAFKDTIKEYGREIDAIITYTNQEEVIELGQEQLNSITPSYEGSILKSVMKQLVIDSNVEIPIETELQFRFGVKISDYSETEDTTYQENKSYYSLVEEEYVLLIEGTDYTIGDSIVGVVYEEIPSYEYINFGNYIVKEIEKNEDTESYTIKCYDRMLYAMKDYDRLTEYASTQDISFIEEKAYYNLGGYLQAFTEKYEEDTDYYKLQNEQYILLVEGVDYNVGDDIESTVYVYRDNIYVEYTGDRTGNPSLLGLYEIIYTPYPMTIRDFINKIANKIGLTFKNANDVFVNYNKVINEELFFSKETRVIENEEDEPEEETEEENENEETIEENEEITEEESEDEPEEEIIYTPLGYTYRDILDQLAQVTASTICINEEDNELEIRYINNTNDTINEEYLKNINVKFGTKYGPVNSIVLSRSAESDNLPKTDDSSVALNGLCEIKIVDNQFMNFEDRETYLDGIYNQLLGLEYYINDFSSTGICYYNLCDKYTISRSVYDEETDELISTTTYPCIMFNDEILINQGLEENIHTDLPENGETDYDKTDKTEQKINKAMLIVNKQDNRIEALVQTVNQQTGTINRIEETTTSTEKSISVIEETIDNGVPTLRNSMVVIDADGLHVKKTDKPVETEIINELFSVKQGTTYLAKFGYENNTTVAQMDNLTVTNYLITGVHRFESWTTPDTNEVRTGVFYIGE